MNILKRTGTNKKENRSIFVKYTCLFLLCSLFILAYLLFNGKTNINKASDGMNQHYRAMLYFSRYLKKLFSELILHQKLVMPHWDFTIGEGADFINALHYHGIGDPFTFLSVFVPERFMPEYYMFDAFARIYLSGLFFIKLCLYLGKKNQYAILSGSLIYAFCFFSLSNLTHHIYFLTPVMLMPLIILGMEKILNDDEPFTFVIAVFWAGLCNIYYLYMEAVLAIVYALVRITLKYQGDFLKIIGKLVYIGIHAILAVLMAAIIVIPMFYCFMGDSRMGADYELSVLYPAFFYERLLTIFVSNDTAYDLHMGFAAPTLLTLALSLKNYKKHYCLTLLHLLAFLFICFPVFGKVFNGFSFVSQRWSFSLALLSAYSLVEEWDHFRENRKYLYIVMAGIFALTGYSAWSRSERVVVPVSLCLVFLLISLCDENKLKYRQLIMVLLIALNIVYIEYYNLSPRGGNIINDLLTFDGAKQLPYTSEAYVMKQYMDSNAEEDGFCRYTTNWSTNNSSATVGAHSTNYYWSITNASDQKFRKQLGLLDRISWQIHGYDNRAELESLANVKYYIAKDNYSGLIPYGFTLTDKIDDYVIYVNEYALPFGYTFDKAISYEDWDQLNALEKQEIMMNAVAIDTKESDLTDTSGIESLPYSIECSEGISINGNVIDVKEGNASLTLLFDAVPDKEYYVIFTGLDYEDIYHEIEDDHSGSTMTVTASNGVVNNFTYLAKSHHYYFAKSDYLGYFGYDDPVSEIKMSFSLIGKYTFDDLEVLIKDLDNYSEQISALSSDHLTDVSFTEDRVSGKISVDRKKYLLLSIPYSKEWEAKVDGETAEVLQADQHYLALRLEAGTHEIELTYHTPGMKIASIISICAMGVFLFYFIRRR